MLQKTLNASVSLSTVGNMQKELHVKIKPGIAGTGITFIRTDITDRDNVIPGHYTYIVDTKDGISLANNSGVRVTNVEFIMAALWCTKISNAVVEMPQETAPYMDNSSEQIIFALRCVGLKTQQQPVTYLNVIEPINLQKDNAVVAVKPYHNFLVDYTTSKAANPGNYFLFDNAIMNFERTIGRAKKCTENMHMSKSAHSPSQNKSKVQHPYCNEAIRHQIIGCIGTLYLCGHRLCGAFHCKESEHQHYVDVLKMIYATPSNYRITTET